MTDPLTKRQKANASERRRLLRRRLEKAGYSPEEIAHWVAESDRRATAQREIAARGSRHRHDEAELDRKRRQAEVPGYESPDDRSFRPRQPDPLTAGPARVPASTARAVRRSKATTRYEYDQQEASS